MVKFGDVNENRVFTIEVSGEVSRKEIQSHLPELDKLLKRHGLIHFYMKLEKFDGFRRGAMWEEIKYDYRHKNQYGKIAVVGNRVWEKWASGLSKVFLSLEMKFFSEEQGDMAWEWVNKVDMTPGNKT